MKIVLLPPSYSYHFHKTEAVAALNTLKPADITVVKSMKNPPQAIKLVMAAVCVMLEIRPDKLKNSTAKAVSSGSGEREAMLVVVMDRRMSGSIFGVNEVLLQSDSAGHLMDYLQLRLLQLTIFHTQITSVLSRVAGIF